jgi:trimethylamine---corrinoid protein Co-methyltransferase
MPVRPKLELLDRTFVGRIVDEAFQLLAETGIRVDTPAVVETLRGAGAKAADGMARIPRPVAEALLASAPKEFFLYDRAGHPAVHYGGDDVHFDPGSSCLNVLDPETQRPRAAEAADLARLVQVTEMLPQYAAQSTAVVCSDVPRDIGDLYRLLVVLWYSDKPVVTGAFSAAGVQPMLDLLAADSGGRETLRKKPRTVFDVCPTPPLNWGEFGAQNLVELARAGVPAEIVSMPLAGLAAPVTLAGAVVQHAAECISGICIHQLACPGAPIVWGGAPAIVDMRTATTPMGAVETAMIDMACAQIGKHFGLPTHAYLVASDSKVVDAQAGMESGMTATLGALAGINMISGAGMLDFLACHSAEKLVVDAEAIGSVQRLLRGVEARTETLALGMFAAAGPKGEFLKLPETRRLFRGEQYLPSEVIDRNPAGAEEEGGPRDTFCRARQRVAELLANYQRSDAARERETQLRAAFEVHGRKAGMTRLAGIDS